MKIVKINGQTAIIDCPYEKHTRHNNYAAVILGLHPKFAFKRRFLERGPIPGSYILGDDTSDGTIIEVQSIYYTSSGKKRPDKDGGFFKLIGNKPQRITPTEARDCFIKIEEI